MDPQPVNVLKFPVEQRREFSQGCAKSAPENISIPTESDCQQAMTRKIEWYIGLRTNMRAEVEDFFQFKR